MLCDRCNVALVVLSLYTVQKNSRAGSLYIPESLWVRPEGRDKCKVYSGHVFKLHLKINSMELSQITRKYVRVARPWHCALW